MFYFFKVKDTERERHRERERESNSRGLVSTIILQASAQRVVAMASPTRSFKDNTVRLISAEGFEFVIDYEAACVSNTIKNMLSSQGRRRST